ncbi:aspartate:alanine exchanger family transporter [Methylocella silvestris]|uniref:YidE/YbjL duplication n=1 Tax=Methylocella silvestris TaxID=199596 RepID=A0A2J7TJ18_METSI|nr:TrkA C-terminal domain-containing protein [Methylocella silvestris]PNG26760.1 YidE/YbjL duplication [Methylocella silvestris]
MSDNLRHFLEGSQILSLFLVIGAGYAFGRIAIFGFSLGIGAVLFAGLALGAFAPHAAPPALVGTIGLLMFLYGIGVQYGDQFFKGLAGVGRKLNTLALFGVLAGLAVAVGGGMLIDISPGTAVGVFAGSMTSTAALQAALEAAGNRDPAIGYSVSYPFGVVGPMLCLYLMNRIVKPVVPAPPPPVIVSEITIDHPHLIGETATKLAALLPADVHLMAIRRQHQNFLPMPDVILVEGDAIMIAGAEAAVAAVSEALGHVDPGRIAKDRRDFNAREFFVSDASMIGVPLDMLQLPAAFSMHIAFIRRGDAIVLPSPHTTLEYGDRVTALAPSTRLNEVRKLFGDSITATAEFSYVSLGAGMVLGVLLGLVPIPLPGIGSFSLGLAGGPVVVALILGRIGRTGRISWRLPLSANLVMRNFGLTIFLAAVGLASGAPFVTQIALNGVPLLLLGFATVLTVVLTVLSVGWLVLRLPFDELLGIAAGATGNPAILMFANKLVPSDRPSVGYAMIFPSMTIVKVIAVQVMLRLF